MVVDVSFALAIPHTPWIPARVSSLHNLVEDLGLPIRNTRIFQDKEPNWSWSKKLWEWGAETDATHLIQLQDDVIAAPNFWTILHAMVTAVPDQMIGLQGAHPAHRQHAREGVRWAQSRAWMVGVAYILPKPILTELVAYRSNMFDHVAQATNEDDLISQFAAHTNRSVYHPIPTIIDHDTEVESTYGNGHHMYRKPTVTWREFGADEITRPEFWKLNGEPPLIQNPHIQTCWFCQNEPGSVASASTQARIGRFCLANAAAKLIQKGTA